MKDTELEEILEEFNDKYRSDPPIKLDAPEADFYITLQERWLTQALKQYADKKVAQREEEIVDKLRGHFREIELANGTSIEILQVIEREKLLNLLTNKK